MSEPDEPTVTASVPRSGSGSSAASGSGLSESLHAVAPSSIATAAANQYRPTTRTMRLSSGRVRAAPTIRRAPAAKTGPIPSAAGGNRLVPSHHGAGAAQCRVPAPWRANSIANTARCSRATAALIGLVPTEREGQPAFCKGLRRFWWVSHAGCARSGMTDRLRESGLKVFATCPPSFTASPLTYRRDVVDVARWSEAAGCEGILVYTDNSLVDPWLVAQQILTHTNRLCPLVAVQPVYMHPYAVAKMVATLGFLHGRRVYLNMVAGGFKNDLEALNDPTPHDERYARLVEYTTLIMQLLGSTRPVTLDGRYYRVTQVKLTPPLDPALTPGVFVSGSSDAGLAAARQLGALAVRYPKPVAEYEVSPPPDVALLGIRIGIIARADSADAWSVARARFPEDRRGQITHALAMRVSDSYWHKHLSELAEAGTDAGEEQPYWMVPFENYKTFCPYLVGSYDRVAEEIARYVGVGYRTIILDVPASADELEHIGVVCERA